jgi:hypothetical protein
MTRRFLPIALLVLLAIAAAACDEKGNPAGPSLDRQVVLAPRESVAVSEAGLTITFDTVVSDSRCPGDAVCITAGDAIVRIYVSDSRPITIVDTYELHTADMKPVDHGDVTIALVSLAPYPFSSRPIDPADYRVTLRVTR